MVSSRWRTVVGAYWRIRSASVSTSSGRVAFGMRAQRIGALARLGLDAAQRRQCSPLAEPGSFRRMPAARAVALEREARDRVPAGHGRVFRPLIGLMRHGRAHAALAAQHVAVALAGVAGGQVDQPHAAARLDVRGDVRVHEQQVVVQVRDKGQVLMPWHCASVGGAACAAAGSGRPARTAARGRRVSARPSLRAYQSLREAARLRSASGSADAGLGSKWGIVVRPDDGPCGKRLHNDPGGRAGRVRPRPD